MKKSFADTGTGNGTASWNGLDLAGPSTTVTLESTEPITSNESAFSTFSRESSISYSYVANASASVLWNATFATSSTGTGYNFTAGYCPSWGNARVIRNVTDVTALVTIAGGSVVVPAVVAAGNNTWTVTCESPNRVASMSFDQPVYYRGQTLSVTPVVDMENLQTDLVEYYDPGGIKRGATIGTSFPLGVYTAVYWCENGTDAGWASCTVDVTDNGSVSLHVTDAIGRAVPGIGIAVEGEPWTAVTSAAGDAVIVDVPFGNYTVYLHDAARGINESVAVEVNGSMQVDHQLAVQWVFPSVPVTFTLQDRFGDGFAGSVTIANQSVVIATTSRAGTASTGGYWATTLDEGTYSIAVEYPSWTGIALNSSTFTVTRDVSTAFSFQAPDLDAHPAWHSGSINASVVDALARPVPGIAVEVDGVPRGSTGSGGTLLVTGLYWGLNGVFNVTWWNGSSMLGSTNVTVATTGTVDAPLALGYQWTFDVAVTVQVQDRFGSGYPGNVVVRNASSGSVMRDVTATAGGFASLVLPETAGGAMDYNITINYPGQVHSGLFGILLGNASTWVVVTGIDAYPYLRTASVATTIRDAAGRYLPGVNVTASNDDVSWWQVTGSGGSAFFPGIYWGNDASVDLQWVAPNGTVLDTTGIVLSSSGIVAVDRVLAFNYTFPGIAVMIAVTDRYGSGFPALVSIDDGSLVYNATIPASGILSLALDEGFYMVETRYPEMVLIDSTSITVIKDMATSFSILTTVDAYPQARTSVVSTVVRDAGGRYLPGINVTLANDDGAVTVMTGAGGTAYFPGVYWGKDSTFDLSWMALNGTVLGTLPVAVTGPVAVDHQLAVSYAFPSVPVTVQVVDRFGSGFTAFVTIGEGLVIYNGTVPSTGIVQVVAGEGTCTVEVRYPGMVLVNSTGILVIKDVATSFVIGCDVDAYPAMHVTSISTTIRDSLLRYLEGVAVTVSTVDGNQSIVTGPGGAASFNAYWGNSSSVNVTWTAANGTDLDREEISVSSTVAIFLNPVLSSQYIYDGLAVSFSITGKFGAGFPAELRHGNGTVLATCSGTGIAVAVLDEGTYPVEAWYAGMLVNATMIVVMRGTGQSFALVAPLLDSVPSAHVASLVTHVEDDFGRLIYGVEARVTGTNGTWIATTEPSGNATVTGIYWGWSASFNVSWWDGGTMLDSVAPVVLDAPATFYLSRSLPFVYTFKSLSVAMNFTDKNGTPFPAFVSIFSGGTVLVNAGSAGGNGYYQCALDEGDYTVPVEYPLGTFVANLSFTVSLFNHTAVHQFSFPGFSSVVRTCSLVVNVKDALGRNAYPVLVKVNGSGIGFVARQAITDAAGNALFAGLPYQDDPSYMMYIHFDGTGVVLTGTLPVTITGDVQVESYAAPVHFTFKSVPVSFLVIDKFGDGFAGTVQYQNGTVIIACGPSGIGAGVLDEGSWMVEVTLKGTLLSTWNVTVISGASQSFTFDHPSLDANPVARIATLVTHVEDVSGRNLFGITVEVTGTNGTWSSVTGNDGNATIPGIYYGYSGTFDVAWIDVSIIYPVPGIVINVSARYYLSVVLPFTYTFKSLPVSFNVTDKNGVPYAATLRVRNGTGSLVVEGGANAYGYYQCSLDEGNYTARIEFPAGTFVRNFSFTVALANHTVTCNVTTGINSIVMLSTVRVNFKDVLGRNVYPVLVRIFGNVTRQGLTDGAGNVIFTAVPYQDDPQYAVSFYLDGTGTVLDATVNVTIDDPDELVQHVSTSRFLFPDIVTTFTVTDAFGIGYRATIDVMDATNSTLVATSVLTAAGQRVLDLDEGDYVINVRYNGTLVASVAVVVLSGNAGIPVATGIDAYPDTHASSVTISMRDALGRAIPGLTVIVNSNKEVYSVTTGPSGEAIIVQAYWGFDQSFDVAVLDGASMLDGFSLQVNGTVNVSRTLGYQYIFRSIPVSITVTDVNGHGYAAMVRVIASNGSVMFDGQASGNGIVDLVLDEGNYTVEISFNGTVVLTGSFEVRQGTGIAFPFETPVDAYPPVFVMPAWAWIAIIVVSFVVAAASIATWRARHEKRERQFRETMSRKKYFEDIERTRMGMTIHDGIGVGLASFATTDVLKDKDELASGLINALGSFGTELDEKAGRMKAFHYEGFSGNLFKGKHVTTVVLTEGDIGSIYREKVQAFVDHYEQKHGDAISRFKGNVTPFSDFEEEFGRIVGSELLEPCTWRWKEINTIQMNPALRHHLNFIVNKSRIAHPSIKDFLVSLRARDVAMPDTLYDGLYDIYMKGWIYPARRDTKSTLVRYTSSTSPEEAAEFKATVVKALEERTALLREIDPKIQQASDAIDKAKERAKAGRLNDAQLAVITRKYVEEIDKLKEEMASIKSSMHAIESCTFDAWKAAGKKFGNGK